jgi:hypothetical protein
MMEKTYKFCQSCGMPMNKDPKKGGSEADGTLSPKYCSYCYTEGKFTKPDMTADQMKNLVKGKMKEMGFPGFTHWFFTMNIPKLERWRKNN